MNTGTAGMTAGLYGRFQEPPAGAVRDLGIPSSISSLGFNIGEIEGLLKILHGRLAPVLSAPSPETPIRGGEEKERAPWCEVESRIMTESHRLAEIRGALNDILARLEI